MISPEIVQEIKRLLADGSYSGRQIARLVGVSRGTVAAIAQGKRPDYEALRAQREMGQQPLGPLERCPGCGGMVYMPCRLCRVRSRLARRTRRPLTNGEAEPVRLELSGEYRVRYERVRAQRIALDRSRQPPYGD